MHGRRAAKAQRACTSLARLSTRLDEARWAKAVGGFTVAWGEVGLRTAVEIN